MDGLDIVFDPAPSAELRQEVVEGIDAFNARTVAGTGTRFGFVARDGAGRLAGVCIGVWGWGWLFVSALYVAEAWRGRGLGRDLLARAEAHAAAQGCHSVWLDTFQARDFYIARGYAVFAELPDYPGPQGRWFLRKALAR